MSSYPGYSVFARARLSSRLVPRGEAADAVCAINVPVYVDYHRHLPEPLWDSIIGTRALLQLRDDLLASGSTLESIGTSRGEARCNLTF